MNINNINTITISTPNNKTSNIATKITNVSFQSTSENNLNNNVICICDRPQAIVICKRFFILFFNFLIKKLIKMWKRTLWSRTTHMYCTSKTYLPNGST